MRIEVESKTISEIWCEVSNNTLKVMFYIKNGRRGEPLRPRRVQSGTALVLVTEHILDDVLAPAAGTLAAATPGLHDLADRLRASQLGAWPRL